MPRIQWFGHAWCDRSVLVQRTGCCRVLQIVRPKNSMLMSTFSKGKPHCYWFQRYLLVVFRLGVYLAWNLARNSSQSHLGQPGRNCWVLDLRSCFFSFVCSFHYFCVGLHTSLCMAMRWCLKTNSCRSQRILTSQSWTRRTVVLNIIQILVIRVASICDCLKMILFLSASQNSLRRNSTALVFKSWSTLNGGHSFIWQAKMERGVNAYRRKTSLQQNAWY